MYPTPTRGVTLVELIVALLVLELAGLIAVTAALQVGRTHGRLAQGVALDLARLDTLTARQTDSACRAAPAPAAVPLLLPAGRGRPALATSVRCGR